MIKKVKWFIRIEDYYDVMIKKYILIILRSEVINYVLFLYGLYNYNFKTWS